MIRFVLCSGSIPFIFSALLGANEQKTRDSKPSRRAILSIPGNIYTIPRIMYLFLTNSIKNTTKWLRSPRQHKKRTKKTSPDSRKTRQRENHNQKYEIRMISSHADRARERKKMQESMHPTSPRNNAPRGRTTKTTGKVSYNESQQQTTRHNPPQERVTKAKLNQSASTYTLYTKSKTKTKRVYYINASVTQKPRSSTRIT